MLLNKEQTAMRRSCSDWLAIRRDSVALAMRSCASPTTAEQLLFETSNGNQRGSADEATSQLERVVGPNTRGPT
jgi:hypothetical protein